MKSDNPPTSKTFSFFPPSPSVPYIYADKKENLFVFLLRNLGIFNEPTLTAFLPSCSCESCFDHDQTYGDKNSVKSKK